MSMVSSHGWFRGIFGKIEGRTIRDENGDEMDDVAFGYPRFCKYAASGLAINAQNKTAEKALVSDATPIGGRPTDDDVEIQYAGTGDPCILIVDNETVWLVVLTEKLLFRICGQSPPSVPGPPGDSEVITAPAPDPIYPPGTEFPQ